MAKIDEKRRAMENAELLARYLTAENEVSSQFLPKPGRAPGARSVDTCDHGLFRKFTIENNPAGSESKRDDQNKTDRCVARFNAIAFRRNI